MTETRLKIDCTQCRHYYVTWDASRPHGCRFFAFKSPYSPALSVFESCGKPCEAFEQKPFGNNNPQPKSSEKNERKKGWVA